MFTTELGNMKEVSLKNARYLYVITKPIENKSIREISVEILTIPLFLILY